MVGLVVCFLAPQSHVEVSLEHFSAPVGCQLPHVCDCVSELVDVKV